MTSPDPFIVMSAPNGARRQKQDHPAVPVSPDDLAICAEEVLAAGASILHLHVRDDEGDHSLSPARYRTAMDAIRDKVGSKLVLQITTESCGKYGPNEQMNVVRELRPEAVSVALRELWTDEIDDRISAGFYEWLGQSGTMAQHILYNRADVERFSALWERDRIGDGTPFVLLVIGRDTVVGDDGLSVLRGMLDGFGEKIPHWAVCGFGPFEVDAAQFAVKNGGHARVGFENNLLLKDGTVAQNNAALVAQAVRLGKRSMRIPSTADQVRQMFA